VSECVKALRWCGAAKVRFWMGNNWQERVFDFCVSAAFEAWCEWVQGLLALSERSGRSSKRRFGVLNWTGHDVMKLLRDHLYLVYITPVFFRVSSVCHAQT